MFTDPIGGGSVAESVMVMNVEYMLGNGRTLTKRVTVIETGNAISANRLFLGQQPAVPRRQPTVPDGRGDHA